MKFIYELDNQTILINILGVPTQLHKRVYIADNGSAYIRDCSDFFFDFNKPINDTDLQILKEVVHDGAEIWSLGQEYEVRIH